MSTTLTQFARGVLLATIAVGLLQSAALAKGGPGGGKMSSMRSGMPRISSNMNKGTTFRQSGNKPAVAKINKPRLTSGTTSGVSALTGNNSTNRVPRNQTSDNASSNQISNNAAGDSGLPHRPGYPDAEPVVMPERPPRPVLPDAPEVPEMSRGRASSRIPTLLGGGGTSGPPHSPPSDPPQVPALDPPATQYPRDPAPTTPPDNRLPVNPPNDRVPRQPVEPAPPSGSFPLPVDGGSVAVGGDVYVAPTTVVETPAAEPVAAEELASVDLVLEDIRSNEPATLVAGPSYRVKFRNQGLQDCGRFRVALVAALDGKLSGSKAVVDVPGLAAGEIREVTLRLPISSLKLAISTSKSPTAFSHLVVALDPDGVVIEVDKTNNAASVERTALEQ